MLVKNFMLIRIFDCEKNISYKIYAIILHYLLYFIMRSKLRMKFEWMKQNLFTM